VGSQALPPTSGNQLKASNAADRINGIAGGVSHEQRMIWFMILNVHLACLALVLNMMREAPIDPPWAD
jgi:hypothetical protein